MTIELSPNQFYFLVNQSGYCLKTRIKEDFEEVCSWGGMLFFGIIKNSDFLHFKVGSSWHKKQFSKIPVARPQAETIWFDDYLLEFSGHTISKTKIGGSQIAVEYEML